MILEAEALHADRGTVFDQWMRNRTREDRTALEAEWISTTMADLGPGDHLLMCGFRPDGAPGHFPTTVRVDRETLVGSYQCPRCNETWERRWSKRYVFDGPWI